MNDEQLYIPSTGIERMVEDIERFLNPIVFHFHPVLRVMSIINIYLVVLAFGAMLFYLLYVRKHSILPKLTRSTNYFAAGALLLLYALLTEAPLVLNSDFKLNFGLIVMPMAAKLFGPVLSGAFGILQYATSFVMHSGEAFHLSSMLVAGLSGMIYGRIIYMRRTTYLRCLVAKLIVNVVCNIILVPMVYGDTMTTEMANGISQSIITNVFLAPVQALAIYCALLIMKKFRKMISEVSWGLD